MRREVFSACLGLLLYNFTFAQRECRSFEYQSALTRFDPSVGASQRAAEDFVNKRVARVTATQQLKVITIPVVIHVLYHYAAENIPDALVKTQISALNRDYRKQNGDTTKIPAAFKALAADCSIQFELATADSLGRATSGIIHKYTPVTSWTTDDQIKFSSEMGDDGWDPSSYLNIWVGTLQQLIGYSSVPGGPSARDGVVISNRAFGIKKGGTYDQGRTAVHEVGHWLGLRHLWGDAECGDDGVADTPQQQTFTTGCPSTVHVSCGNGPNGDMYMDYMDFTNDDCLVMFTQGQKARMRALFEPGGPRYSILSSNGLSVPTQAALELPDDAPQWLHVRIYPNPATRLVTVNLEFDARWVGKELTVLNDVGQSIMKQTIISKIQRLDINQLKPGLYFICAEKDGEKIHEPFIKF